MSRSSSTIINPPSIRKFNRSVPSRDIQLSSNPPIHILDDDSLLHIFYLYRPAILLDVDVEVRAGDFGPPRWGEWTRERWWYKLSHICQRWRRLIFVSASYLGLCLFCTYRTPVERMLKCSPHLPIVLDYAHQTRRCTEEDKDGILLALQHRARVRRIRLCVPGSLERKLCMAMEAEFQMLEYLYIGFSTLTTKLRPDLDIYPAFQAPRLCHLALTRCPFLVTSPSLTTSAGLVTLSLMLPLQSRHDPYDLFRQLSLLSQLVVLRIAVSYDLSNHELEGQQLDIPHLTLPNLRLFEFEGSIDYLETLLPWMTTPLLEKLQITVLPYMSDLIGPFPTHTFPCLQVLQFMSKADVLGFASAKFLFNVGRVTVWVYPREGARMYVFYLRSLCGPFGLQVSEMASIFEGLSPALSTVDDLTIDYSGHNPLYEGPWPMQWRDLLRSFNHVKTLRVQSVFAENFSRSLSHDGEPLPEVLPGLQVLECPVGCDASAAFATFVHARNAAGHPIRLILVDPPGRPPTSIDL